MQRTPLNPNVTLSVSTYESAYAETYEYFDTDGLSAEYAYTKGTI